MAIRLEVGAGRAYFLRTLTRCGTKAYLTLFGIYIWFSDTFDSFSGAFRYDGKPGYVRKSRYAPFFTINSFSVLLGVSADNFSNHLSTFMVLTSP